MVYMVSHILCVWYLTNLRRDEHKSEAMMTGRLSTCQQGDVTPVTLTADQVTGHMSYRRLEIITQKYNTCKLISCLSNVIEPIL